MLRGFGMVRGVLIRSASTCLPSILMFRLSGTRKKGRIGLAVLLQIFHKTGRFSPSYELPDGQVGDVLTVLRQAMVAR